MTQSQGVEQTEVHISSMVVHAMPDYLLDVRKHIEQLPGTEIHAESPNGKLVVVVESQTQTYITDVIEKIAGLDHVLSTALVYHQIESQAD
jgi:nitrate reductase NapD